VRTLVVGAAILRDGRPGKSRQQAEEGKNPQNRHDDRAG
jgi:hypothetical protein